MVLNNLFSIANTSYLAPFKTGAFFLDMPNHNQATFHHFNQTSAHHHVEALLI